MVLSIWLLNKIMKKVILFQYSHLGKKKKSPVTSTKCLNEYLRKVMTTLRLKHRGEKTSLPDS